LVCRNYERAPRIEWWGHVLVRRLPTFAVGPVNRALNFPLFLNPMWIWFAWRVARSSQARCIIVADLPLAPTAIMVGWLLGIPVHYDMAEVYPEFLKSLWKVGHLSSFDRLLRNPGAAALLERHVMRLVGSISVVSEESRARAVASGARSESVFVVGNTPDDVEELARPQPFPSELSPFANRARAVFVGTLIADRGVTETVQAFRLVAAQMPEALLVIVGDGPDRPRVARTVERLRLHEHVVVLGWRAHETLGGFYQHCHVGLLPFLDTPHVRVTMANKLFDYMAAGLPVLGADLPPIRRILDETQAGLLFAPDNQEELASRLVQLLRDTRLCRALGANGRRAVVQRYNWKRDEAVFLKRIAELTDGRD
jgi:glycosyltransferase involved in cell wall biosynthesis